MAGGVVRAFDSVTQALEMITAAAPEIDYVLPIKWDDDVDLPELTSYLTWLAGRARVIVVDGSPEPIFDAHARAWRALAVHVRPDPAHRCRNGKVAGVRTGLALATAERVVIADDDIRYDDESLARTVHRLDRATLVGPQNVFEPMPWHARWDSARSLLNRALGADYPGTFAIRAADFEAMGGYDGDVLFENLELMRTVRANGGRVVRPHGIYVVRRPPTSQRFWQQRVRQAYDDLAQPWRLLAVLPVVPALALAARRRSRGAAGAVGVVAGGLVGLAEIGRRRAGGTERFPGSTPWLAPVWVLERAVCSWVALALRVAGGVRYADARLPVAAHSTAELRRRAASRSVRSALGASRGGSEPAGLVRPVAERLHRRSAAPAERNGSPTGVDLVAVGGHDAERTADDQRPVDVRADHHRGFG